MGKRKKARRDNAIGVPPWEPELLRTSQENTRRRDRDLLFDAAIILLVPPLGVGLLGWLVPSHADSLLPACLAYGLMAACLGFRAGLVGRRARRGSTELLVPLLRGAWLTVWVVLGTSWVFLAAKMPFMALPAWWAGGLVLLVLGGLRNRRLIRHARLIEPNHHLFALTGRRGMKKRKKLGSAAIFELPEDSPLGVYQAVTSIALRPRVFLGARLRRLFSPDEVHAIVGHEVGHSLNGDALPYQLVEAGWHLAGLPLLALLLRDLSLPIPGAPQVRLLTSASLAWLIHAWVSRLLQRRIELSADAFATTLPSGAQALAAALSKLGQLTQLDLESGLLDRLGALSHPSLTTRIRRLCEVDQAPPSKGRPAARRHPTAPGRQPPPAHRAPGDR
jgi:Zn-dependent protease with chaperone function